MDIITHAETKYLGLYEKDGWFWAERPNSKACVGILPITDDGELVLVEQLRIPVDTKVIEIPAGLYGDEESFADESLADCAARELLEETGYRAETITHLIGSPTSAGMTPEITHLFSATGLTRETAGGGVDGENILVHHAPLDNLTAWLRDKETNGYLIDFKIHAALWLTQQSPNK
ncbi:MAG: NUDIX hydrolase [Akkermansiaceae bacterium]